MPLTSATAAPLLQLLLPLHRLDPGAADAQADPAGAAQRTLDLTPAGPVTVWAPAVSAAGEPCLLLDSSGRVCAMSNAAAALLGLEPHLVLGARLSDLLTTVDFSLAARPDPDQLQAAPMLRSLAGGLGRSLLRLRHGDGTTVTYDVVAVPLSDRSGSLSFLRVVSRSA